MKALDQNLAKGENLDLIDRARNGDGEALNQLVMLHQDNVRRFVGLRISNWEDVEDVSQQILIRGCRKFKTFRGRSTLRTWLLSIAKRAVSDFYRENRWSRIVDQGQVLSTNEETDETHHGRDLVREICQARQHIRDCLRCVLRALPVEEQVAVLLADMMGCSDKETAGILGKNLGALKHLLHRARVTMDVVSLSTCALVRKTGDGPECAACKRTGQQKHEVPGNLGEVSISNSDAEPREMDILSLRADFIRNLESLINSEIACSFCVEKGVSRKCWKEISAHNPRCYE